jgi:hypothetical protein
MGFDDWIDVEKQKELVKHAGNCVSCIVLSAPPAGMLYLFGALGVLPKITTTAVEWVESIYVVAAVVVFAWKSIQSFSE